MVLRAPFPWFGGKSRVADVVWRAFGNVPNYVEPFYGSGAVLLGRPHEPKIETVNDKDCFLANFWRAVATDPDAVAFACAWPVNEADLHARHAWLVAQTDFVGRMRTDADFYDVKVAGWWVWGLSMWIGSGWCDEAHVERNRGQMPAVNGRSAGMGVHRKLPDLYARSVTRGVHESGKRPHVRNGGQGVHQGLGQLPDLQGRGRGISVEHLPSLGNMRGVLGTRDGRGAKGAPRTEDGPPCLEWFRALQARLRRVRVCCGDWTRVLTNSVLGTTSSRNSGMNPCAVFLDPPYDQSRRSKTLYSTDDAGIAADVAKWAREHGEDKDLRVALCGHEGEHEMPGWTVYEWKGARGYAGDDNENRSRERIWFSPHCLPLEARQPDLFSRLA